MQKRRAEKIERGDIFRKLFIGGDNSRYGLINAVTAASKIAKTYDRATELERIGDEILALPIPRPKGQRCMFLLTLRAVANSLDRKISESTVTKFIAGVRETYLKKTSAYTVEASSVLYALHNPFIQ